MPLGWLCVNYWVPNEAEEDWLVAWRRVISLGGTSPYQYSLALVVGAGQDEDNLKKAYRYDTKYGDGKGPVPIELI